MNKRTSRKLVVDTSVATSASEKEHPVSSSCRDWLMEILDICHHVVITDEMNDEWRRHESRFMRKWRLTMSGKHKPLQFIHPESLGWKLDEFSEKNRKAIEKDLHLLEAAAASDGIIITRDTSLWEALGSTAIGQTYRSRFKLCIPINPTTHSNFNRPCQRSEATMA